MDEAKRRGRSRSRRSRRRAASRGRLWELLFLLLMILAVMAAAVYFLGKNGGGESPETREAPAEVETETLEGEAGEETGKAENGAENTAGAETPEAILQRMTPEEKVLQLFMITPEALTGVEEVYAAGERTQEAVNQYPVGGLVYFRQNLRTPEQTADMLSRTARYFQERIGVKPFLGVDEEGGQVARISGREEFGLAAFPDMREIGGSGDPLRAADAGQQIGEYLKELGFNLDFAPVADVLTNPANTVVARRAFSDSGIIAAEFTQAFSQGLSSQGILPVLKHFPGHGGTEADSHEGYAQTNRTLEELTAEDFVPFQAGIDAGAGIIMAGHISAPAVTGDETPATLSYKMITEILRGQMGFEGVVITDAMNMGAITEEYSSAEAAVAALKAGCDMILMPENFAEAYEGVLESVRAGEISQERLDQSVLRILRVKNF